MSSKRSADPSHPSSYVLVVPRSDGLAISPNLSKLIEHDQRSSFQPRGLPPPPRPKNSNQHSPSAVARLLDSAGLPPLVERPEPVRTHRSSSLPVNPYINPPPAVRYQSPVRLDTTPDPKTPPLTRAESSPDSPASRSSISLDRRSSGESSRSTRLLSAQRSLPGVVLGMAKGAFKGKDSPDAVTPTGRRFIPPPSLETRHDDPRYEPRISISSTHYDTNSASSIDNRMYHSNRPSTDDAASEFSVELADNVLEFTQSSPDRNSFIDLASPVSPPSSYRYSSMAPGSPSFANHSASPTKPLIMTSHVNASPSSRSPTWLRRPSLGTPGQQSSSRRSASVDPPNRKPRDGSPAEKSSTLPPPPTTNLLDERARAELIKKTRKITKMFGQTPDVISEQYSQLAVKRGHFRGAGSAVGVEGSRSAQTAAQHLWASGRRHSSPLSPDQVSFLSDRLDERTSSPLSAVQAHHAAAIEIGGEEGTTMSGWEYQLQQSSSRGSGMDSPTSFMDLSDGEHNNDDASTMEGASPRRRSYQPSIITPSILEHLSPEEQAEEERRRKRDRLAKLHRFLGSRVPADLVLELPPHEASLPSISTQTPLASSFREDSDARAVKVSRRRSSSAAMFPTSWSNEVDRLKEELDEREKAINVRRALKMERVFGIAPPQTLYHTRQNSTAAPTSPTSPTTARESYFPQSSSQGAPSRNRAPSGPPAKLKSKKKKQTRPGTSESNKHLLPNRGEDDDSYSRNSTYDVYAHYRQSVNSLSEIIDRDDRESLAELHEYLNSDVTEPLMRFAEKKYGGSLPPVPDEAALDNTSETSSQRSVRRRSLPSRSSMISISTIDTAVPAPPSPGSSFQQRRKRAAKLTHFFGVDYREVIGDIIDSIEKGVEDEGGRGSLKPEQVQVLLHDLRKLKTRAR